MENNTSSKVLFPLQKETLEDGSVQVQASDLTYHHVVLEKVLEALDGKQASNKL